MGGIRYGALAVVTALVVFGGIYQGDDPPVDLIGFWEIEKVQLKDKTIEREDGNFMELREEGVLRGGNTKGEWSNTGSWSYSEESNVLSLEGNTQQEIQYEIVELSSSEMTLLLLKDSSRIFMTKKAGRP